MKEVKPNRYHRRVIALAAKNPVILTHHEKFEDKWTSGGIELSPSVVIKCIRQGWLKPSGDGLFEGSSQTFVPT